jgi:hypothetical protein
MDTQNSSPSLVANWRDRMARVRSSLLREPTSPLAWRWRMEVKVLAFLQSRYGTDAKLDFQAVPTQIPLFFPPALLKPKGVKAVRSGAVIGKTLNRIADINRPIRARQPNLARRGRTRPRF